MKRTTKILKYLKVNAVQGPPPRNAHKHYLGLSRNKTQIKTCTPHPKIISRTLEILDFECRSLSLL